MPPRERAQPSSLREQSEAVNRTLGNSICFRRQHVGKNESVAVDSFADANFDG
jgi:hypothetical protein